MKHFTLLFVFTLLLFNCQEQSKYNGDAYGFIPTKASLVIKINDLDHYLSENKNTFALSAINDKALEFVTKTLKHFNTNEAIYVSFTDSTKTNPIIATKNFSDLIASDSLQNIVSEFNRDTGITKFQTKSNTFYHKVEKGVFLASNHLESLEKLNYNKSETQLKKLLDTSDSEAAVNLFFETQDILYSKLLLNQSLKEVSDYCFLDINFDSDKLSYNGILTSKDENEKILNYIKVTSPQQTQTLHIAPKQTTSLLSIPYDDFSQIIDKKDSLSILTARNLSFLNFTSEVVFIEFDNQKALAFYSSDSNLLTESFDENTNIETYRDSPIFKFENSSAFTKLFKPLIHFENAKFATIYKNHIIFSNTTQTLKSILTDASNSNTLSNSEAVKTLFKNDLNDKSSVFIFKNSKGLKNLFNEDLKGYEANVVQITFENNHMYTNGVIQKFKPSKKKNEITEDFSFALDAESIIAPQIIKGKSKGSTNNIIQDVNNVLYCISQNGNLIWKKTLQGKILGKVEQIGINENGRLQLAFTTSKRLYILDRNGKDLSNFPLKFNDNITQPLSVFDYDNKKNYRLLVTQGQNLLMYDVKGKTIKGFSYKAEKNIKTQPKHFRISNKDYIVFAAGKTLKILSRRGTIRVTVNKEIPFSGNPIFLHKNKFTTTTSLGELIQVDSKGNVSKKSLQLSENHKIDATSKTLVTLKENQLHIKSKRIDLDYGNYTEPKIFYINNKIYATTTDLQAKKIYLFDSQGKSIPNFPIFGTSQAQLFKSGKNIGLITQTGPKNITLYKFD